MNQQNRLAATRVTGWELSHLANEQANAGIVFHKVNATFNLSFGICSGARGEKQKYG